MPILHSLWSTRSQHDCGNRPEGFREDGWDVEDTARTSRSSAKYPTAVQTSDTDSNSVKPGTCDRENLIQYIKKGDLSDSASSYYSVRSSLQSRMLLAPCLVGF